jgi:hypothetical protein
VKDRVLHLLTFKGIILAPCGQSVQIALDFQTILGTTHRKIQFHVIGTKKNSYVFENLSNVIDKPDEVGPNGYPEEPPT